MKKFFAPASTTKPKVAAPRLYTASVADCADQKRSLVNRWPHWSAALPSNIQIPCRARITCLVQTEMTYTTSTAINIFKEWQTRKNYLSPNAFRSNRSVCVVIFLSMFVFIFVGNDPGPGHKAVACLPPARSSVTAQAWVRFQGTQLSNRMEKQFTVYAHWM